MSKELTKVNVKVAPMNRVEGDLEIHVFLDENKVVSASASATMFRGFEMILKGKSPMDPLVITPRICGICGQAHLRTAVNALENAYKAEVPKNANLIRNICLAAENVQSHYVWFYALFAIDLVKEKFAPSPFYEEVVRRFAMVKGSSYQQVLKHRKRMLEINAMYSGQWPHSSFMVPGGVTSSPFLTDLTKTIAIIKEFQDFLERNVYGCSLERWLQIKSLRDLNKWLSESESHRNSDFGLFYQFALDTELDRIGRGPGKFLAAGVYEDADNPYNYDVYQRTTWLPAGYYDGKRVQAFDHMKVQEHIAHSYFKGYENGRHPWQGVTNPDYRESKEEKYSFAKSPRYDNQVVEVGPLARMVVDQDPLIMDMLANFGPSVFLRAVARFQEAARTMVKMYEWLEQIDLTKPFYKKPNEPQNTKGVGLNEAARGALMHWTVIEDGRLANYQVITPTAWNVSPRDSMNNPGAIETALLGTTVMNMDDPVELGNVVRSFDPCLVCTVHSIQGDKVNKIKLGL